MYVVELCHPAQRGIITVSEFQYDCVDPADEKGTLQYLLLHRLDCGFWHRPWCPESDRKRYLAPADLATIVVLELYRYIHLLDARIPEVAIRERKARESQSLLDQIPWTWQCRKCVGQTTA